MWMMSNSQFDDIGLVTVSTKFVWVIFSNVIEGCSCRFTIAFHVGVGNENSDVADV